MFSKIDLHLNLFFLFKKRTLNKTVLLYIVELIQFIRYTINKFQTLTYDKL